MYVCMYPHFILSLISARIVAIVFCHLFLFMALLGSCSWSPFLTGDGDAEATTATPHGHLLANTHRGPHIPFGELPLALS